MKTLINNIKDLRKIIKEEKKCPVCPAEEKINKMEEAADSVRKEIKDKIATMNGNDGCWITLRKGPNHV